MDQINQKQEQKRTTAKKHLFLAVVSMTLGSITKACEHTRISRDTYYDWCKNDPKFADDVEKATIGSMGYFVNEVKKEIFRF